MEFNKIPPEGMEDTVKQFRFALADIARMEKEQNWQEQRVEVPLNRYAELCMKERILLAIPVLMQGRKYDIDKVLAVENLLKLLDPARATARATVPEDTTDNEDAQDKEDAQER